MRLIVSFIILIGIVIAGFQLYQLYSQKIVLQKDFEKIDKQLNSLTKENKELTAEVDYFNDPDNLEKELRARFNYTEPGEKLIIVVPRKENQ